jgi:xylulokinase
MAIIGLDIGTTGCKAHVFTETLDLIFSASKEYKVDHPHPMWAEQDADYVWKCVKDVIRQSAQFVGDKDPIKSIGLAVQGEAVTAVDQDGNPLRPMILGMDTRTDEQNQWIRERFGAKTLFEHTGMPIHTINTLPKLLWLKDNEPEFWNQADRFMLYEDFIINKLTHQPGISLCLASRTQLYDLSTNQWSTEILDVLGLDPSRLSPLIPSGTAVGRMAQDIAEELGFKVRPVIGTGGHDQACGALGSGLIQPGLAMVSTGTAEVVEVAMSETHLNDVLYAGNMSVYRHTFPGLYVVMTLNQSGGYILRWFRDTLCEVEKQQALSQGQDVYDLLLKNAPAGPSPVMLLPHFSGSGTPTFDTRSKGAFVGLTFSTTKAELAKAIIDGLTMELRLNLEILQKGGIQIDQLRAIGGGARSDLWLQVKADVTNIPVAKPRVTEATGLGGAILGAVAAGVFDSPEQAISSNLQIEKVFEPNSEMKSKYDDHFEQYKKLYPALKSINHNL